MTKVLILGGGFGGVRAALDLSKTLRGHKDVQITLVDKHDAQTFFPSLYEVASAYGIKHQHPFHSRLYGTILIPYRDIFAGTGVEVAQAEVTHIDLTNKHVITSAGNTLEFSYLVIALGSSVSTFNIPGVEEYAYKFKNIEDAVMLNDKLEELYQEAAGGKRELPVNIIIGGGGFTGIELAAELSNCAAHIAHRHQMTSPNCSTISLIEAGPVIMPMISGRERQLIRKRLAKLGINIMEASQITEVGPDFVKLNNGQSLKGDLIVWSAGVRALDIFNKVSGLELDDRGRIKVNDFLQASGRSNIFAVGDNIVFIDATTRKPVPQLAYLAIGQGRMAARNIAKLINSKTKTSEQPDIKLTKYSQYCNVWVVPAGGKYAIAHLGPVTIAGFSGYLIRELIDLRYFLQTLPLDKAWRLFWGDVRNFSRND